MTFFSYDRKYGVAATVYFAAAAPASSNSDYFYTGVPTIWNGPTECMISADGGAFTAVTADPAQVTASYPLYSLAISAAEMQFDEAFIYITDSGTAARDVMIHIRTHVQLSSVDIDAATGTKANTTALTLTGYGSGHGLSAVAGATGRDYDGIIGEHILRSSTATGGAGSTITLDASASATNDYYNGCVIHVYSGTGAGQARVITDYVGSTKVATVNTAWATNPASGSKFIILGGDDVWNFSPGAELSAFPTFNSSYAAMLQWVFQRFAYPSEQTATTFTTYKADGSTALGTGTIADDGTTQTHGIIS